MAPVRRANRRGVVLLSCVAAAIAVGAGTLVFFPPTHRPPAGGLTRPAPPVAPGAPAPDFAVKSVRGVELSRRTLEGRVVLLSFVDVQTPAGTPEAQPSRAQVTFLKSMHTQYSPKGVAVILVDGSRVRSGRITPRDTLYNMTFSWNLGDQPLVNDDSQDSLASRHGVKTLPTTFLITKDRVVAARWDGLASTPELSRRLQELVGVPAAPR